jgi:hypothetical protein
MHRIIFVLVIFFALSQSVLAGCLVRDIQTAGKYKQYSFCKNSLRLPSYQIAGYFNNDQTFSLFSFDPRGVSVICHEYDLLGTDQASCQSAMPGFKVKKVYKNKNSQVVMLDLDSDGDIDKLASLLQDKDMNFKSSKTYEEIEVNGCFAGVNMEEETVYLGYTKAQFHNLPICLMALEGHFKKNKKQLLDLL